MQALKDDAVSSGRLKSLDEVDHQLIKLLQAEPRRDKRTLAEELGVSAPTLSSRLRGLSEKRAGALRLQRDFKSMGYRNLASLDIEVSGIHLERVAAAVGEVPEVLAVLSFLESPSLSAQIVVTDPAQLYQIIADKLSTVPGIGRIRCSLSLRIHRYSNLFAEHQISPSEPLAWVGAVEGDRGFEEDMLAVFQDDATLSNRQVAKLMGTTEHRVRRNLNRLLDSRCIAFNYLVSPIAVGMQVWAYFRIAVEPKYRDDTLALLMGTENCVSICEVAGEWNFLAWFVAQDTAELGAFSNLISRHALSISARAVQQIHKHNCDYARIVS